MFPLQRNVTSGKCASTALSLFVSHSQKEANGTRILAMYDISRAHFHGVPVRSLFVELPDAEKERLASEEGSQLEHVGLLRKCMYGTVDASARGKRTTGRA